MIRFHVHLNVNDLGASIRFYTRLLASEPTVLKDDYAKWMIDDPRVNFAISNTGRAPGVDHLGLQVDSSDELAVLGTRLDSAGGTVVPEEAASCCYARSDKNWTEDPQGTRWETFHTLGEATSCHARDTACATDGATCTLNIAGMEPKAEQDTSCCAPKAGFR